MRSTCGCVLALMLIGAGVAHAQETGPWKVLVTSTANPLRVAECSPVRIDVTDAKGNARNPKGVLISLADFDVSVAAGRDGAIVGRYDGAAAWSACACPGAAGATATITATYPARSLPRESRMPGVTFQSSISVPVIAGRSSGIPIGCEVVKTTTAGAGRDAVPWAVTIVPSLRAVPIGNCTPVYIDLRDAATKGGARNPKGVLVSLADFDMSVSSSQSGAVAGRADGASAWSVCGCQGASVGTMATITATYPARALVDASRVPGVAFQSSTTISLAAATGTFNPPACVSPQSSAIAPASSRVLTPAPAVAAASGATAAGGAASAAAGGVAGAAAGSGAAGREGGAAAAAGTPTGSTAAGTAAGATAGGAAAGAAAGGAAGAAAKNEATPVGAVAGTAAGAAASGAARDGAAAGGAAGAAAKNEATTRGTVAGGVAGAAASGASGGGAAAGAAAGGAAGAAAKNEAAAVGTVSGAAAGAAAKGGATAGNGAAGASAKTEAGAGGAVAGAAGAAGSAGAAAAGAGAAGGAATGAAATGRAATTGAAGLPTGGTPVNRVPIKTSLYEPGPASATLNLSGHGSWYEPGPVSATLSLSGHGSWYEPGPVTVTFGLSGTGNWLERAPPPAGTFEPAPPRPR